MTQIWQPVIWQPNQQLDKGKYTITGILGGGGFGSTYTAKHKSGTTFAIKTLNTQQQTNKTTAEFTSLQVSFVNEALRLARCHHPHIVQVYEVVEHQGLMGMVMEYIQGQNLAELVEDNGPMSHQQALKIMEQIGAALTLVHSQELLHRDIKPQNIMLRRDGNAVLIDFGLARQFAYGQTGTMTNSRTECYAPIEQYKSQGKFGPYTDVYALAATLYNLRTGKSPIPANFRDELKIPLPEPKQHNPQIPDWENAAILKGLELEAANRPQSVAEWLKLLGTPPSLPLVRGGAAITPPSLPLPRGGAGGGGVTTFTFNIVKVNAQGKEISRRQGQAKQIITDLGNGVTLEMVYIPGGTFTMGSPANGKYDDEKPQHQVTIKPFLMGKYPVTQAQWRQVASFPKLQRDLDPNPSGFKGENLPVERVSWYDAVEWCARLSKKIGKPYRLPSEAEWEYAARAGTTTAFHIGETLTTELANYHGDYTYGSGAKGIYRQKTNPVGHFQHANAFGLYDIHGNVWEWCADPWHDSYSNAPSDGRVWDEANDFYYQYQNVDYLVNLLNTKNLRVLRGGSWDIDPDNCRCAYRDRFVAAYRFNINGFRVSCLPPETL
ncbi:SUMF1/EgtB/PvdO family nonheme iron enzyme [Planktothricoides sp. FACHB-1370]|uniref:SUMF1/EgtB/PvdO family nonheme iron enzyme n=2 Tax=Planktothricoides raciborskii TaxID=132608 RepID=A0ABR8EID4_9CYAN|nr:SUMF1/EgtB/PvdO family nonheme iron enzyme [Planktothricoides raciborskii FACHB-1370]